MTATRAECSLTSDGVYATRHRLDNIIVLGYDTVRTRAALSRHPLTLVSSPLLPGQPAVRLLDNVRTQASASASARRERRNYVSADRQSDPRSWTIRMQWRPMSAPVPLSADCGLELSARFAEILAFKAAGMDNLDNMYTGTGTGTRRYYVPRRRTSNCWTWN